MIVGNSCDGDLVDPRRSRRQARTASAEAAYNSCRRAGAVGVGPLCQPGSPFQADACGNRNEVTVWDPVPSDEERMRIHSMNNL